MILNLAIPSQYEWYPTQSEFIPEEFLVGPHTIFLRRNIVKNTSSASLDDGTSESRVYYTYEETKIPVAEFNKIASAALLLNQQSAEDDRLTLMEAMVDLYESTISS